jgi:RES domain
MTAETAAPRDLAMLDAIDACPREPFSGETWRVVREDRDPLVGSKSLSRWCDGTFDVLYTSLERDGAIAEVYAFWSMQPVFPSKIRFAVNRLNAATDQTLKLLDLKRLKGLGVDVKQYASRDYSRTAQISGAAWFLGFDGIIAPSARWNCLNLMVFTAHATPPVVSIAPAGSEMIDWAKWKKRTSP